MPTFRIRDWNAHFENNRTRDMKRMAWVPIPVKLAGDGYTEMIAGKDGPAVYGAWIACVLVAASCGPRGTLLRGNGEPHDPQSLSRITRIRTTIIQSMIERAQSVGWIEDIDPPQEGAGIPQEGASKLPSLEGRNPREGILAHPAGADACPMSKVDLRGEWQKGFPKFWEEWPRKVSKADAIKAWGQIMPVKHDDFRITYKAVLALLRHHKTEMFDGREKGSIPYPATWLRDNTFNVKDVEEALCGN